MAQQMMVLSDGRVLIPSFVDGGRIKRVPERRMSVRDITARINWLERHGHHDKAEALRNDDFSRMN